MKASAWILSEGVALSAAALAALAAVAAAVYEHQPPPWPLNVPLAGTNVAIWVTNEFLQSSSWPRPLVVFEPLPATGTDLGIYSATTNIVATNYPVGYLEGTNRVVIGTFIQPNAEKAGRP